MGEIQVSMTELRQSLGNLVNRAAYGGEQIVLVAHGEPKAAIISVEDLRRLQQLNDNLATQYDRYTNVLTKTDLLRERIQQWQEAHNVETEDAVETLRHLREKRDDELIGLH
jgi:prevent-host-death family protein